MPRPSKDEYYLGIARAVAMRSTCLRKAYGAIIVKNDRVIATGYNGMPVGEAHCVECTKISCNKDIAEYLTCSAVHAEQNVIISASREEMRDATLYLAGYDVAESTWISAKPCEICLRLIKNAGIAKVINKDGVIYCRNEAGILSEVK